mmetsp:Transcript_28542/g.58426  ORF Transcript_28542/g.58426 Transcript_28542/m.58426 type:complete len:105 (+) Transcript_28542:901-1215(+)
MPRSYDKIIAEHKTVSRKFILCNAYSQLRTITHLHGSTKRITKKYFFSQKKSQRCAITNVLGVFNTRRNNFSSSFSLMSTIPPNSYFQTPLPLTSFLATSFPNK